MTRSYRAITVIEDHDRDQSSARLVHIEGGRVTVSTDNGFLKFRIAIDPTVSLWGALAIVAPLVAAEEARLARFESLASRCRAGWTPAPDEIDPDIAQKRVPDWFFPVDAIRFPDDEEFYAPATKIASHGGTWEVSEEILWLDRSRLCDLRGRSVVAR